VKRLQISGRISAAILLIVLLIPSQVIARDFNYPDCRSYPVGPNSPTGVVGCKVFGIGQASWYSGPTARNDCEYPWLDCQPIVVTSLTTGRSITIVPAQYCDCYLGDSDRSNDRMVDLSPSQVLALGLTLAQGLYKVRVEPAAGLIPNTAFSP
jgi:hypothetical protein